MPHERFFLNALFEPHASFNLTESEFHHLVNVSRCRTQDTIELVNGKGQLGVAIIDKIEKKQALVIVDSLFEEPPVKQKIILAQAYPRAGRLDTILEKTTELGVTDIWLFSGEKSERKEASSSRIESILISAMKQSGRLYLPNIHQAPLIQQWKTLPCTTYFGDFAEGLPSLRELDVGKEDVMIVIGPESGLTEKEVTALKSLGAKGVSLSKNILRTDTAAIIAVGYLA